MMGDELELLGLVALGFAVGTYGTIIGLGGGFILVPALLFLYPDDEPERFTAVSLAVVWANSASGSVAYARQGRVDYRTGLLFAASSIPGVIAGVFLVRFMPERVFTIAFALLSVALAAVSFRGPPRGIRAPLSGPGVVVRRMAAPEGTYRYAFRLWQGAGLSLGVGLISSLFGIGGGAVHVPAMITMLHFPVQFAVATSQFILTFMSGGGTVLHLLNGTLEGDHLIRAGALALGAVPGAQAGATIARRLKAKTILMLLGVALLALSARLMLKGITGV